MAVDIFSAANTGASLSYLGKNWLDAKMSVNYISELENLRPYLADYAFVVVEKEPDYEGTVWQMQPNEEDGWVMWDVTGNSAQIDDTLIDDETVYSSLKVENTFAKSTNVYTKTEIDTTFGTLAQQEINTTDIATLKTKTNSLTSAMRYMGNLQTYGELLLLENMENGHMYFIDTDETHDMLSTKYIFNGEQWVFNGVNQVTVRDFETEPINLGEEIVNEDGSTSWVTEVKGRLKLDSIILDDFGAEDVSYNNGEFTTVKEALDSLLYKALTITFTTGSSTSLEKGNSLTSITFVFGYNKDTVIQQNINGEVIPLEQKTYTHNGVVNTDTTFTLTATDEKQSYTKSISFNFYSAIYSGHAPATETYDSEFVLGLQSKKLSGSCLGDYTINCPDSEYIYFAIPTSIANQITFWSGGFCGGVDLVAEQEIENAYNAKDNYYIYRTTNGSLGATTITIKK